MGRTAKAWHRDFDGWWYGVTVKGAPPQKLLKASNTKANQKKADDFFRKLTASTNPNATLDSAPCADLVELFLTHAERHCKPSTFRTYSDNLNYFTGFCGKVACRELTLRHGERFLEHQATKKARKVRTKVVVASGPQKGIERLQITTVKPWGPNQQATFAKILRTCFNWGVKREHISRSPFQYLSRSFVVTRQTLVTDKTLNAILKAADAPFRDLLVALRHTGCRPSEIASVTAEDVDTSLWCWILAEHKTDAGGQPRTVWLDPTMVKLTTRLVAEHPEGLLFRNARGRAWRKDAIVVRFQRLRKKLKLPAGTIAYALRHTFITDALANGVPISTVADLAGNSERVIRRSYAHLHEKKQHMQAAILQANRGVLHAGNPKAS